VSLDFATADQAPGPGHAVAGTDYTTTTGTVNFALGEQVKTIAVPVLSDSTAGEPDETFLVNLTNPANGNIVDAQAILQACNRARPLVRASPFSGRGIFRRK
jgi:hypothetical protein